MNRQMAKEELTKYKDYILMARLMARRIVELDLKAQLPSSPPLNEPIYSQEYKSKLKELILAKIDLEKKLLDCQKNAMEECARITQRLVDFGKSYNLFYANLLQLHYVDLKTYGEMSKICHYNIDYLQRLVARAIDLYAKKMG